MNEKQQSVQDAIQCMRDSYNRVGSVYEQAVEPFHRAVMYPVLLRLLEEFLPTIEESAILDAGCGAGSLMDMLQEKGAISVGVDVSSEFVVMVRNRGLQAEEASITDMPFVNGAFNAIISNFVINNLPLEGQQQALSEFARVLKPEGVCVFSCIHPSLMRVHYSDGKAQPITDSYYIPQRVLELNQLGETFRIYLTDFSEIINWASGAGFIVQRVIEPAPPDNLEAFIEHTTDEQARSLLESFRLRPYGLYVVLQKK